jgi:signal transduction histidine kinase
MTLTVAGPEIVRKLSSYVSASSDRIALIDSDGQIVAVDNSWISFAEKSGARLNRVGPGANYLDVCRRASESCPDAREALIGIETVIQRKSQFFSMDYWCHLPAGPKCFRMAVMPFECDDAQFAITHTDITKLRLSRDRNLKRLRTAARRLINAQEEERKRLARELHDDLGTRITLLSFAVHRVINQCRRSDAPLAECAQVIDRITDLSNALRNLSHCLHPPLLQHSGICGALKALCEEFEQTHGVEIDVVAPTELPVPDEVGLCIFRVSQECLHNIAKHANAGNISVVLERTPKEVRLKVADTGCGFSPPEDPARRGLGLTSMKERVLAIHGQLKIQSAPGAGTEIHVSIPLTSKKSAEHERPVDSPGSGAVEKSVQKSNFQTKVRRYA